MNRILALVLAGVLGTSAAAAKDTLSLGMVLEPPHLDPTAGAAAAIREVTYANLYEGLVRIDAEGRVRPALAASWSVSADGLTYTFHLQPHVTFQDGTPFDCPVVAFSYGRALAADSVNAQKGLFEPIESVSCPDPATAVVRLRRPTATFLFGMGWGDAVMVSPHSIATDKTDPVGTGPFRFVRWVRGDHIVLERFPGYWGKAPALERVTFRFITDPNAAAAAMLSGTLDAFPNFPAPEMLARLRADPKLRVVVGSTEGKTLMALNEARKPFDDIRVRRALAAAIDRKGLVAAAMSGFGVPIGSHYVPTDPGYVDLTGVTPYDPARARALLAEAGVRPGTQITLTLPPPAYARRSGEVVAAYLAQVGLVVRLVPVEWAEWLDQVFTRADYDATIVSHTEPRDLDIYARRHYYFNYHAAAYRLLWERYQRTTDPGQAEALLGELQRKLADDVPNVFLFALPKLGVWRAQLHGMWHDSPIPANDVTGVSWDK
jgi:peptide/nickel transport system substrate-binding protein